MPTSAPSAARERSLVPALAALLVALLGWLAPPAAAAGRRAVAVLEFAGAPKLRAAVVEALGQRYALVPLAYWDSTARELNAAGPGADEIAIVALTLKVDAVVTAVLQKDPSGAWMIVVAPRNGPSGKAVELLRYPVRSPLTAALLIKELGPAVERAIAGPPPESPELRALPAPEPPVLGAPQPPPRPATASPPPAPPARSAAERRSAIPPFWAPAQVAALANVAQAPIPPIPPFRAPEPAAPAPQRAQQLAERVRATPPLRLADGTSDRTPEPPVAVAAPPPVAAPPQAAAPPVSGPVTPLPGPAALPPRRTPPVAATTVPAPVQTEPAEALSGEVRPRWYPYLDASAGFIFGGRQFNYDEGLGNSPVHCYDFQQAQPSPSDPTLLVHAFTGALTKCAGFSGAAAPGLRLDATVYPLARVRHRWIRQLGIGATVDMMFWPSSTLGSAMPMDPSNPGASMGATLLQTHELRAEAGLRWTVNLLDRRVKPALTFSVQYGLHSFSLEKGQKTFAQYTDPKTGAPVVGPDDHGLPDITYQYVDLGAGARLPYDGDRRWYAGMLLDVHYHALFSYGDLSATFFNPGSLSTAVTPGQSFDNLYQGGGFGPVQSGNGVRVSLTPLELVPWKGLTFRVSGYYEVFLMSFALGNLAGPNALPPIFRVPSLSAFHIAQGAMDQYFGGVVQIGYQY